MTTQTRDRIIDDVRTLGTFLDEHPEALSENLAKELKELLADFWAVNDRRQATDRRS